MVAEEERTQEQQIISMTRTQTLKSQLPAVNVCSIYARGVKQTW